MEKIMQKNVGATDKIIRGLIAIIIFVSIGFVESRGIQLIMFIGSALLLFTITTSWCGLYALFKINTR